MHDAVTRLVAQLSQKVQQLMTHEARKVNDQAFPCTESLLILHDVLLLRVGRGMRLSFRTAERCEAIASVRSLFNSCLLLGVCSFPDGLGRSEHSAVLAPS